MLKRIVFEQDHPLSRAHWIWPEGAHYMNNCHAQFRHDFELKEVPGKAPFFITADQSYRLYVNGKYICRGPARGYQSHWPYDEVDLHDFLRTGHNWISIEAYNPGVGTFQYIYHNEAGMICAAEWGDFSIHSIKAEWQIRRSPANKQYVPRLSTQMAYQEDFNANADDLSWIYEENPVVWTLHEMFRWCGERDFGRPPWYSVEERGIPMLREKNIVPEKIASYGTGKLAEGWKDCFNPVWFWEEKELPTVKEWKRTPDFEWKKTDSAFEFNVPPQKDGTFLAVTIALPAIEIGTLGLKIKGSAGNEIADAYYYQYLPDAIPQDLPPVGYGGMIALADRLRLAPEYSQRMFYVVHGAKYIVLVLRNAVKGLQVAVSWRTAEYPFDLCGKLETSDPDLNAIYEICRNTQQICSSDAFMDTPWREQGQWWGDARIQGKNAFFISGDTQLLHRGVISIAGQEVPEGLTMGVAPCCSESCVLPDFSLAWILSIYDYWQMSGDLSLFREQLPRIDKILNYFQGQTKNGLIRADSRFWLFEDWADLVKTGYPAFLNIWHLYALIHCEKIFRAAGLTERANAFADQIKDLKILLKKTYYDPNAQLIIVGLDEDQKPIMDKAPSLHDQVLAILTGLVPEAEDSMVAKRLLPFLHGEKCDFAVPTSFWCSYLFDAAKLVSLQKEALDFIRKAWGKMVPSCGAWEHLVWNRYDGQSCCHAWSAHPVSQIPELMFNLKQLSPAWATFSCNPDKDLLPESGEFVLPLKQGLFRITWKNGKIQYSVPDGCRMIQ